MAVSGIVTAEREAVGRLMVLGPGDPGKSVEVEAVLDTGFTGQRTLPPEVVAELGLPLLGSRNSEDFNPGAVLDGVSFASPLEPAFDPAELG